MKFRLFLSSILLLSAVLSAGNADAATYNVNGNDTWTGDRDFNGAGISGGGIFINSPANSGIITTDGNIAANASLRGVSASSGGQITFNNISDGKTFTANNNKSALSDWNTGHGIYAFNTASDGIQPRLRTH